MAVRTPRSIPTTAPVGRRSRAGCGAGNDTCQRPARSTVTRAIPSFAGRSRVHRTGRGRPLGRGPQPSGGSAAGPSCPGPRTPASRASTGTTAYRPGSSGRKTRPSPGRSHGGPAAGWMKSPHLATVQPRGLRRAAVAAPPPPVRCPGPATTTTAAPRRGSIQTGRARSAPTGPAPARLPDTCGIGQPLPHPIHRANPALNDRACARDSGHAVLPWCPVSAHGQCHNRSGLTLAGTPFR